MKIDITGLRFGRLVAVEKAAPSTRRTSRSRRTVRPIFAGWQAIPMTFEQAIQAIEAGGYVVDIGQLAKGVVAALRRKVKRGELIEFDYYGFPHPKRAWSWP